MTYITQISLARQGKLYTGEVANLYGSIKLAENLTISGNTYLKGLSENLGMDSLLGIGPDQRVFTFPIGNIGIPTLQKVISNGNNYVGTGRSAAYLISTNEIAEFGVGNDNTSFNNGGVGIRSSSTLKCLEFDARNNLNPQIKMSGNAPLTYESLDVTFLGIVKQRLYKDGRISGSPATGQTDFVVLSQLPTFTANNGLTKESNTIILGGTLNRNTDIFAGDYILKLGGRVTFEGTSSYVYGGIKLFGRYENYSNAQPIISLSTSNSFFGMTSGNTTTSQTYLRSGFDFSVSQSSPITTTFYDENNLFGIRYNADYSAKGKLDNRWIPDLGAVKTLIAQIPPSSGGTGGTGNYIINGSTLQTGATFNIDGNGAVGGTFKIGSTLTLKVLGDTITFIDELNNKGVSYGSDYSLANVTNPRWLTDKAYVDSKFIGNDNPNVITVVTNLNFTTTDRYYHERDTSVSLTLLPATIKGTICYLVVKNIHVTNSITITFPSGSINLMQYGLVIGAGRFAEISFMKMGTNIYITYNTQ